MRITVNLGEETRDGDWKRGFLSACNVLFLDSGRGFPEVCSLITN